MRSPARPARGASLSEQNLSGRRGRPWPSRKGEEMVKYRETLRQRALGVSIRNVALSCGRSTATVRTASDKARAAGLEWPLPEETGDEAIRAATCPPRPRVDAAKAAIDHARADAEMGRPGAAMQLLWSEHCESALARGEEPYMCSAFCRRRPRVGARQQGRHADRARPRARDAGRLRGGAPCRWPTSTPASCRGSTCSSRARPTGTARGRSRRRAPRPCPTRRAPPARP